MNVQPTEHHNPEHHEEAHQGRHPSFKQYVLIAIILFAITMVEFLIIVPKALQGSAGVVAPLVILSAIKFGIVIMFYMHLKFDARMFSIVFLAGLFLAFLVGSAAIGLFGSFQPTPRAFAACNAQPFTHGGEPAGEVERPEHCQRGPKVIPTPVPPVAVSPSDGDAPVGSGLEIYTGVGTCYTCHKIESVPQAVGVIGPDQTNIGTDGANRIPGMSAEEYIRQSIVEPDAYLVEGYAGGLMAPLVTAANLSEDQIDALVEFLLEQK